MGDPATTNAAIKEKNIKELKRQVEGWREVIVLLHSVLIWEQNWYPALIFGSTSFIFLTFWRLDPSLLTAVSVVCLLVTILDTLVPTLSATFCNPTNWTGNKERQLEEFCKTTVENKLLVTSYWNQLQQLKTTQPKAYYAFTIISLCFLAWLGNWNNLLLTYIFATTLLMVPGLVHHGLLQKYFRTVLLSISSVLKSLHKEKAKTN